jgi:hypothetical protein
MKNTKNIKNSYVNYADINNNISLFAHAIISFSKSWEESYDSRDRGLCKS